MVLHESRNHLKIEVLKTQIGHIRTENHQKTQNIQIIQIIRIIQIIQIIQIIGLDFAIRYQGYGLEFVSGIVESAAPRGAPGGTKRLGVQSDLVTLRDWSRNTIGHSK